jgi:hypothetical protein
MKIRIVVSRIVITGVLVAAFAQALLGSVGWQAGAADSALKDGPAEPVESGRANVRAAAEGHTGPQMQGDADVEWTISGEQFESLYPEGFRFTATISSSAGVLSRARVIWTHAPGTQRSRPAEIDPETGEVVAVWDATGADAVPPWVGVTYHWDVSDTAGNRFETEPVQVEYEDPTREWVRTESDDVIVFSESLPEEIGLLAVDAMAQQRPVFEAAFGSYLPYTPRVILFGDRSAWEEWQITAVNPRVVGTTSNDWGGTVQITSSVRDMEGLAYGTVPHEIAHLHQSAFTIMTPGTWLIEGNATFFEAVQQYDYERMVRNLAANGTLPVLLQGTGPGVSGQNARRGYDVGYTFWKWLVMNYGYEGHRELIELLDTGIRRNEAIEQVTGLSLDEVERQWRVWLGASEQVPTLIPTPTLMMFPTVTPFGQ